MICFLNSSYAGSSQISSGKPSSLRLSFVISWLLDFDDHDARGDVASDRFLCVERVRSHPRSLVDETYAREKVWLASDQGQ